MAPMMSSSIQVRNSFSDHKFHSRSKAQMCLKKIIDIIISSSSGYSSSSSSLKPCEKILNPESNELKSNQNGEETKRGIDVDLNLRLGLPLEELEVMNEGFSACSVVGEGNKEVCGLVVVGGDDDCNSSSAVSGGFSVALDKSSEGECDDPKEVENSNEVSRGNQKGKEVVIDEQEFSEITNLPIRSFVGEQSEIKSAADEENEAVVEEEVKKFQRKKQKNEGYLDLLVEAARLISGDFEENKPDEEKGNREELKSGVESEEKNGSKRSQRWMLDMYEGFEDISPVVRSKRGRNQVLPYRYRDSVLDPWKRLSRQRSSKNKN